MKSVADRVIQRILGRGAIEPSFFDGLGAGLRVAGHAEIADALADWEHQSPDELATTINRWFGDPVLNPDLSLII